MRYCIALGKDEWGSNARPWKTSNSYLEVVDIVQAFVKRHGNSFCRDMWTKPFIAEIIKEKRFAYAGEFIIFITTFVEDHEI